MFNVYWDLSPYTWFTPYFSAGIGWTEMEYNFTYEGQGTDNYSKDNFTWSAGGGISAKMTNRLNIDAGYRYFDMGKIGKGKIRNHEFYGGVRYVF
jgi:outer membrane autotransporter protein